MRLADLCTAHGSSLTTVAAAIGVSPTLLTAIDMGRQPLPSGLASQIASVLRVQVVAVKSSVSSNTDLNMPVLYRALPVPFGFPLAPARIHPLIPHVVPELPGQVYFYVDRTEDIQYVERASGEFLIRREPP
jgi:hypothetical protein